MMHVMSPLTLAMVAVLWFHDHHIVCQLLELGLPSFESFSSSQSHSELLQLLLMDARSVLSSSMVNGARQMAYRGVP
jgi:hypothetical protein